MRCSISFVSHTMSSCHQGMKHLIQASLLVSLFLASIPALSQTAQITGVVTDAHGAVIVGAEIQVVNQASGAKIKVLSDKLGTYFVPAVQPGLYQITVSAKDFGTTQSAVISLAEFQNLVQNVKLAVGAASTTVTVNAFGGISPTGGPNPSTTVFGGDLLGLSGAGHSSTYLVANLVPGVIADTADPYGLSFTRSLNIRGRSDFFLSRTINNLPVYGVVGATTDLLDLENVASEHVYAGPLLATQGLGFSNSGGVLDQTMLEPRSAPGVYVEQGGGADSFRRTFIRLESGELKSGTALFASGSSTQADNWKGPGLAGRNNVTASLSQKLGSAVNLNLDYVHNEQRADNYDPLTYAQSQNLAQYYMLSYLPSLTGVSASSRNQLYTLNQQQFTDDVLFGMIDYKVSPSHSLTFSPYYWLDDGWSNSASGTNVSNWIQHKDNYGFDFDSENQLTKNLHLSAGYWFQSTSPDPPPVAKKNFSVNAAGQLTFLSWSTIGVFTHFQFQTPFAQLTYTKNKTTFTAGLRYEVYRSPQANYFLTAGIPNVSYGEAIALHPAIDPNGQAAQRYYNEPLPNAGFQRQFGEHLQLDLSYSRKNSRIDYGPQASSFFSANESKFIKDGLTLQNLFNLLKPEIDDEFDVIPVYHQGRLTINPDFYYYKAHNKEVFAIDPVTGLAYYQSKTSTTGYGLDLSAEYQIANAWSVYAGANTARETYDSNISLTSGTMYIEGRQIPNDPKETIKGMLTYRDHGMKVDFISRYTSSRFGLADDSQRVAPYALFDFNATYDFGHKVHVNGLKANFSVQNLLNRKYIGVMSVNEDNLTSMSYYAGSPRTMVGSLAYSFGRGR